MNDQPPPTQSGGPEPTGKAVKNGRDASATAEEEKPRSGRLKGFEAAVTSLVSLFKIGVIAVLVFWFWNERDFVKEWLSTLTGGEAFGVKFQREEIDKATSELQRLVESLSGPKKQGSQEYPLDKEAARDAIIRASRVAPAVIGSRILWVDDHKENNTDIAKIIESLKIDISSLVKVKTERPRIDKL